MQYLESRIQGHKSSGNLTALKKHEINNKHQFDYDKTSILTKEKKYPCMM